MTEESDGSSFEQAVKRQLEDWARENPDELVAGSASSSEGITRQQLYENVLEGTSFGSNLLRGWERVAARAVLNCRITDDDPF